MTLPEKLAQSTSQHYVTDRLWTGNTKEWAMPIMIGRISGASQRPGSRRAESGQWFCTILIALALASLTGLPATAQSRGNLPLVGVLEPGALADASRRCFGNFQQGLRDLGYVEGQHLAFAYRSADNQSDRRPDLAAELVRLTPDVLWTYSLPAVRAARQATTTIPIVGAMSGGELGRVDELFYY
jgi:ABC-type uncharacterized transport system substrate-binding protein